MTTENNSSVSVWLAQKDGQTLASSSCEKSTWRLLGARGKKQVQTLKDAGFVVRKAD
jgi:hypothetical protein